MEARGDKATAEGMELLRGEVEKLKEHVKISEEGSYAPPHPPPPPTRARPRLDFKRDTDKRVLPFQPWKPRIRRQTS